MNLVISMEPVKGGQKYSDAQMLRCAGALDHCAWPQHLLESKESECESLHAPDEGDKVVDHHV
ncbi:MAG: hypothetical protein JWQ43_3025 [Glaciihabitans sp.]|nr:hypothetical protein [Glaciihabitans sp.]